MTTQTYLSNLSSKSFAQLPDIINKGALIEKTIMWVHTHPTTIKVIKTAISIFAIIGILSSPFIYFSFGIIKASLVAVSSSVIALIAYIAHKNLDIVIPPVHDMKTHAFMEKKCKGARLYYKGDVPIFEVDTTNPYVAGKAHGYLLADHINELRNKWQYAIQNSSLYKYIPFIHHTPKAKEIPNVIRQIKQHISHVHLLEMQGIVDGFNKWAKEQNYFFRPKPMTLDESILMHLEADSTHLNLPEAQRVSQGFKPKAAVACTSVVDYDKNKGFVFARNMDWPTLGKAGPKGLVFLRKNQDMKTAEVLVPGLCCTLTGMNEYGLCISLNICANNTTKIKGTPIAFVTKSILEECKTVHEVKRYLDRAKEPLGPFHIVVADKTKAACFHMKQNKNGPYKLQEYQRGSPLVVTNFRYDKERPTDDINFSKQREANIAQLYDDAKGNIDPEQLDIAEIVETSITLSKVNNLLTSQGIVMYPTLQEMRVVFDNAYATKNKLHTLSLKQWFS